MDLERHRPVDLLPDRTGERLAQWLTEHPGIESICRDRGGAYADGARLGAPDAVQVADRWHLLANLGAMLERVLVRHHALLRQVQLADDPPPTVSDRTTAPAIAPPRPPTRTEQERQRRDRRREARYQEIHALHHEGYSVRAIARQLGLHRQTVRKYLAASTCPHPGPRPNRGRMITPYLPSLRQRWETGERRGMVLWTAIRAQGFPGSWRRVQEQLAVWRRGERRAGKRASTSTPRPIPAPGKRCAPRQVAGWLGRAPNELTPTQQTYLEALIVAGPELGAVRSLAQDFMRIVRTRDKAGLDTWLVGAEGSETAEVREFAAGIRRDYAAVSAALAYAWSSGQVEGQINRLKLVKRSMYGRSGFNLLRQRFLLAA